MEERKKALVTGASRGIGRAICEKLASKGTDIVFSYRSGEEAAAETIRLCSKYGVEVHGIKADVSSQEECESLIKEAVDLFGGRIDILVNNAGITKDNLIGRMKDEDFDAVIDVNLKGTFYMMRGVSRYMLRQRAGRIINMSSVVGVMGNAGQVNYSASKAGVIGMTKSLARELASRQITVNAVAPGMIETDMTAAMPDAAKERVIESIPFKQMGRPEDIAEAVAFLAGDGGRYITGQVLCVDGGMAI
ncbi:MAG: 3-oxoacyl-[acyl-carrier-protein] reductase [Clostridia bacterium]|nr:3-oxoacyl-[acyl-carrier-protein] reductase [Clostridia bacterium]